jgi:hypothetical protein
VHAVTKDCSIAAAMKAQGKGYLDRRQHEGCVRRAIGKLKVSGAPTAPNRHEPTAAARLPPTPLAKLLRGMSRVCLTHCSVHQPWCYVPWHLATADTTPASTARSSSGAALHRWLSMSSTLHSPRRRQALVTLAEED